MTDMDLIIEESKITKLIIDLGRCLDEGDFVRHGKNFIEDGVLILPFKTVRSSFEITKHSSSNLGKFAKVYHVITDIVINIDNELNSAKARANVHALHLFDVSIPSEFAELGGYYNFTLIKNTNGDWKFKQVELVKVWSSGKAENIGVNS
ncbi:SnoaL-like domain-containing protein [Rosenbergiella sp. S61]|uniref:SnoaL-like domain-containing protein n=1 Tax=Rosenbergiella gaditana TaxID=2726987 RepID=A0ABS5T061_9GAMM|nr:nuclear transport factor 2 family protein [Rosenbergiella gaditana]MBT0725706.1 SnoaL-like domain-containing protein [Rosenbergiella gaditana]